MALGANYKAEVFGAGGAVAPGGGSLIADTGALPAGVYDLEIMLAYADAAGPGKGLIVEHRNAANGGTIRILGATVAGCSDFIILTDIVLLLNERVRVITMGQAGAALSEADAMIRARQKR